MNRKEQIIKDLNFLVDNYKHRQHENDPKLIIDYISSEFSKAGAKVSYQKFNAKMFLDKEPYEFCNIIASYGPETAPRIIIGAHYDTAGETPGADDNGSGIVGLLDIARQIQNKTISHRIDLVAFANEEPPFFAGPDMGSVRHAQMLKANNIEVEAMICLEMIGVFYEEEGTQDIPNEISFLKNFIKKGNFIAICGRNKDKKLIKNLYKHMEKDFSIPIAVPEMTSIWLHMSDHMNYWAEGFPAIMLTDTAYMRHRPNQETHYHEKTDTVENINFDSLMKVTNGVINYITN